ncbi:hypothetical protein DO65_5104 [Burkholderia pseudomallei]|nr:hypothetical protein DO73_1044 [Burkholderia pseudomallei]KGC52596.1 hypothetical protein DO65_5104 [Burkholderia pseudomallei]KGD47964.1 hypothetical protein DP43_1027 [Burkholderia pseudomallei]
MQLAPKRPTLLDVVVPCFAKRDIPPPGFGLSCFVSRPLSGPYFSRVFTLVNQRLQLAGFDTSLTEIPSSSITDGHSDGFAEQPRLEDVSPRASRSHT